MTLAILKDGTDLARHFNRDLCRKIAPLWAKAGTLETAYWGDILIDAACFARDPEGEKTVLIVRDLGTNTTTDLDRARDLIARNDWEPLAVWIVTRGPHNSLIIKDAPAMP